MARPETFRDPHDVVALGIVAEVDCAAALVRLTIEGNDDSLQTGWLPWASPRAGSVKVWLPPSVGEQVIIVSPDADLESGIVIASVFQDSTPPIGDGSTTISWADGAKIAYDPSTKELLVDLPSGGLAQINAPAGLSIIGDVTVTGKLTASDDVIGGGKSLKGHKHTGVAVGGALTGGPQ